MSNCFQHKWLGHKGYRALALGAVLLSAPAALAQQAAPSATTPATPAPVASDPEGLPNDVLAVFGVDQAIVTKGGDELQQALKAFQEGNVDRTVELLRSAHALNGELPPANLMLARLFFLANNVPVARQVLEKVIADDANVPDAYLLFGNLALLEGQFTDAQLQYEKAIATAASIDWSNERRQTFQQQCYAGLTSVAEQRQNWEAAKAAIYIWLRMTPNDANAHVRLARALFNLKQTEEALAELQKAFELNEEVQEPEVSMGWLYTQSGDEKNAETWMQNAAKKYPDEADVRSQVSAWYLNFNRVQEAQEHALAAAALDPESDSLKRLNGVIAMQRKDYPEAEKIFSELYSNSPGDFFATNYLALALVNNSDAAKQRRAVELAEINARQYPKSPDALSTLGWIYYRVGRTEEAEQVLMAAVQGNEGRANSDTAYYLAHVLADRQRYNEVAQLLESAINAPGRFTFREEAQEWLDKLRARPQRGPSAAPAATQQQGGAQNQ